MKQVMAEKTNTTGREKSKYKFSTGTSANSPENKQSCALLVLES